MTANVIWCAVDPRLRAGRLIRLRLLTDSLRNASLKLAADVSRNTDTKTRGNHY